MPAVACASTQHLQVYAAGSGGKNLKEVHCDESAVPPEPEEEKEPMQGNTNGCAVPEDVAVDLTKLLMAGMFEEFMGTFRRHALALESPDGATHLADQVNEQIEKSYPQSGVRLVVSQKQAGKHLIMISDGSRFFGDSWTISRQMFVV